MRRSLLRSFGSYFKLHTLPPDSFSKVTPYAVYDPHAVLASSKRHLKAEIYKERGIFKRLSQEVQKEEFKQLLEKADGRRDTRQSSEPELIGDYYYYTTVAFKNDKDYSIVHRFPADKSQQRDSKVIFDPVAEGLLDGSNFKTFHCTKLVISHCQNFLAIIVDLENNERTVAFIKDIKRNKLFEEKIESCSNVLFGGDSSRNELFYVRLNEKNRPSIVYRKALFASSDRGEEFVFEENDAKWFIDLMMSKCQKFIFLVETSNSICRLWAMRNSSERGSQFVQLSLENDGVMSAQGTNDGVYFVQIKEGTTRILFSSKKDFEAALESLYARQNPQLEFEERFNSHLVSKLPENETLTEIDVFESDILMYVNSGLTGKVYSIAVHKSKVQENKQFAFHFDCKEVKIREDNFGAVSPLSNVNLNPKAALFTFDSPKTFNEQYELNLNSGAVRKLKEYEITGKRFNAEQYVSTRIECPARDGALIPAWILHHKGYKLGDLYDRRKTLVKSYGCYGIPSEIGFSVTDLNLLEDDWTIVWPMVRGGGDLGPSWHKAAQKTEKHKTVDDLEDVATHLIAQGITHPGLLCMKSSSAGAGMIAALINRAPHLLKSAILTAPFLDISNLLLDENQPLSQSDYEEFGNPRDRDELAAILGLCPYSNLRAQEYPAVLINCFDNDYRTPLWQVIKWVKKARELALPLRRMTEFEGKNIFLNIMKGSHNGIIDHHDSIENAVFEHSFLNWIINAQSQDVKIKFKDVKERKKRRIAEYRRLQGKGQ